MNDHIRGEDLAAYVDGLLAADKKKEIENHFSGCAACLDELAEITAIMRNREKIPVHLLKRAMGAGGKGSKPVLHLRLVFEVAAALVVVVFIGYLFLSGNRLWQTPEQAKPLVLTDKNVRLAEPAVSMRMREIAPLPAQPHDRSDIRKSKSLRAESDADLRLADSIVAPPKKNAIADKGLTAGGGESLPSFVQENQLQASPEEQRQLADEKESALKKELARTAPAPQAVGGAQMDLAAKDRPVVKAKEETFAAAPFPRIRIEGDVDLGHLRNPELFSAWTWWQNGLILELRIDAAGTVFEAVPLGKTDPLLARQAENEAKKLLFSVSEKKSRRARLIADEKPPIPAGL
jgi:hypothetical protein